MSRRANPGASRLYWSLVAGYVALLFALQPRLGFWVDAFKERWGPDTFDLTTAVVSAAGGLAVAALLVRAWQSATRLERGILVLAGVLYGFGVAALDIPQERLHYLEYGLLSGLICFGLQEGGTRPWWQAALAGTIITSGLGFLDETLQDRLWERRYFDWRDVSLNARAAVLGVMVAVPLRNAWGRR